MRYDVFGMCNPLYDIQAEVADEVIRAFGIEKGGMFLVEREQQADMVGQVTAQIVKASSGGSGANTMIGLALLGGMACYTGKIGRDAHGDLYTADLRDKGVELIAPPGDGVTGTCLVLISSDAERTMCTCLSICRELGPDDVNADAIRASKYIYVTGFLWDTESQKAAVLRAMQEAKAAGVKVALSLSDPFCVGRHKADFLQIAREYVDCLIGNDEETQMLTDTDNPQDAILATRALVPMAVVTMGGRGSLLRDGNRVVEVLAVPVRAIDTNGAGDMYAAGLLYGLTRGLDLETTGHLAAYAAAQVVAQIGPRLDVLDQSVIDAILRGEAIPA